MGDLAGPPVAFSIPDVFTSAECEAIVSGSLLGIVAVAPAPPWAVERVVELVHQVALELWNATVGDFGWAKLVRYGPGGGLPLHIDDDRVEVPSADWLKGEPQPRGMAATVQLDDADSYEGGDLVLRAGGKVLAMNREQGALVIYPASVEHQVTTVTAGCRRALCLFTSTKPRAI